MKKITSVFLFFAFLSISFLQAQTAGELYFTAHMNGEQETPPVTTAAEGVGVLILNATHDTLCVTISMAGLTDSITGIHIHQGDPGVAGPVVVNLMPYLEGNQVFGTITGSELTPAFIQNLLSGHYYLNAHTPTYPNGEIRGQIMPEANELYVARLDGLQQVPANNSPARALGIFNLASNRQSIHVTVFGRDLVGAAISANLRTAPAGQSGSVTVDLVPIANGTAGNILIDGTITSNMVTDYPTFLNDLRAGNVYVNVQTDTFMTGEIRGQLYRDTTISFYARMNSESMVPPVSPSFGLGIAYFNLNASMDSLHCEAIIGGLSDVADTATLNIAAYNANGPVSLDFTDNVAFNFLDTVIVGFDDSLIHHLFSKNAYLVVGNPNNPSGEIRGQFCSSFRPTYGFLLNGEQETPPVATNGYGSGFLSVDPDSTDARFVFVYGGLTGPVTAAHFHMAPIGVAGPPIFDLMPYIQNDRLGMGRWAASDTATPLNATIWQTIDHDSVYANLHTAQHQPGEVRGQLLDGLICNAFEDSTVSVSSVIDYNRVLNVYPNPAGTDGAVNVRFVSDKTSDAVLTVYDMIGKKVMEATLSALVGTNLYKIDMSRFESGVYNLRLSIGNDVYTQRVSKQ